MLALLPKMLAPGVVVLPPVLPNSPPPPPAAGVAAFPPVLPNRLPPEDCPAVLVVPNRPPVAGFAVLFPKRPLPEPMIEWSVSLPLIQGQTGLAPPPNRFPPPAVVVLVAPPNRLPPLALPDVQLKRDS